MPLRCQIYQNPRDLEFCVTAKHFLTQLHQVNAFHGNEVLLLQNVTFN